MSLPKSKREAKCLGAYEPSYSLRSSHRPPEEFLSHAQVLLRRLLGAAQGTKWPLGEEAERQGVSNEWIVLDF